MRNLTVPAYVITLILSAFLLFSVQPMFAKMILPLLGGSPSVWNVAMVFFQAALLGGYAYAHLTTHFMPVRGQAVLHMLLLAVCLIFLPLALPPGIEPSSDHPILWQLSTMLFAVGAPFFVVAASAPMIQRWFTATGHRDAHNPYFLYAASNIGSLLALLSYPVVVEPLLALKGQTTSWAFLYGILMMLTGACALLTRTLDTDVQRKEPQVLSAKPSSGRILAWLLLSLIPSSLLLGVTTFITTDLASMPLLWIIPLALYLITFIIAFSDRFTVSLHRAKMLFISTLALFLALRYAGTQDHKILMFAVHLALFFSAALLCHKKLYEVRPAADRLTHYYMIVSLGGVLGGAFNSLAAPLLFNVPVEYTLALAAVAFVCAITMADRGLQSWFPPIQWKKIPRSDSFWLILGMFSLYFTATAYESKFLLLVSVILAFMAIMSLRQRPFPFIMLVLALLVFQSPYISYSGEKKMHRERNFFGILTVSNTDLNTRILTHGTTIHGAQALDPEFRMIPLTYYNPAGPMGDVFSMLDRREGNQEIAILGLGVGTVSCYAREGRHFDFYEIDPAVQKVAENKDLFTYLSDCGSPYDIVLGDGRLKIAEVPDGQYDMIALDAFSSDNIPIHVITLEAFRTYMSKLKPGGIIIFNISNRYLDLEPVLQRLSAVSGVPALIRFSNAGPIADGTEIHYSASQYVVFTQNPDVLVRLQGGGDWAPLESKPGLRVWTDDYANLLAVLRHGPLDFLD